MAPEIILFRDGVIYMGLFQEWSDTVPFFDSFSAKQVSYT